MNGDAVKSTRDLALDVANTKAGDTVKITVWRDGQSRTLDVTIGTQKAEQTAAVENTSEDGSLGMELAPLTGSDRQQLGLDSGAKGVIVSQVAPGQSGGGKRHSAGRMSSFGWAIGLS